MNKTNKTDGWIWRRCFVLRGALVALAVAVARLLPDEYGGQVGGGLIVALSLSAAAALTRAILRQTDLTLTYKQIYLGYVVVGLVSALLTGMAPLGIATYLLVIALNFWLDAGCVSEFEKPTR